MRERSVIWIVQGQDHDSLGIVIGQIKTNSTPCGPSFLDSISSLIIYILDSQVSLINYTDNACSFNSACSLNLTCLLEVDQGLVHNLQILQTRFTNKVLHSVTRLDTRFLCTRTPIKRWKCYSPTSSQARVLVVQASNAAYLHNSPSRFFSYDLLNTRKRRNSYQWAMYEGNFSRVLNQEFLFLVHE